MLMIINRYFRRWSKGGTADGTSPCSRYSGESIMDEKIRDYLAIFGGMIIIVQIARVLDFLLGN